MASHGTAGSLRIVRVEGGETYVMEGEYLEFERTHRLRFTIGMPLFSPNRDTTSLEIMPEGAGCVAAWR